MAYVLAFLCMYVWTIMYEYVWIFLKCVDWFNHHFEFLANFLSNLWCIFAHVFPSHLSTITSFQGAHSSQPTYVRTSHAPSLTHCSGHTLTTNTVILLASIWNRGQDIVIRPNVGTPTPNGLRSNWDFLLGRSSYMLVSPALPTISYYRSIFIQLISEEPFDANHILVFLFGHQFPCVILLDLIQFFSHSIKPILNFTCLCKFLVLFLYGK